MVTSHINTLLHSVTYRINNALVDPGDVCKLFENVEVVLLTHAHFDHIYGLNALPMNSDRLRVYTNMAGREMLTDAKKNMSHYHESSFIFQSPESIVVINDGEEILLGHNITAKAVFTPGHNPSCITWMINDGLFTGDSYIPGLKTVTNLPGGNKRQAIESLEKIKQIAVGRTIYPGHQL